MLERKKVCTLNRVFSLTGCRGPAAATNNGTISVLLGVAVGSGKQEVVLK